jgi:hypothetical protein
LAGGGAGPLQLCWNVWEVWLGGGGAQVWPPSAQVLALPPYSMQTVKTLVARPQSKDSE